MEIKTKPAHPGNYKKGRAGSAIKYIILHFTGNNGDTAQGNAAFFARGKVEPSRSAHYFVDETSVWRSVDDADTAWHVSTDKWLHPDCRNANSLAIELCSYKDAARKFAIKPKTVANAVELVKKLMKTFNISVDNVFRHFDITGKHCPEPFVRDPAQWAAFEKLIVTYNVDRETNLLALMRLGVVNTSDYWLKLEITYLDDLLAKAAVPGLLDSRVDNGITDLTTALSVLVDAGIINTPDYWQNAAKTILYVKELLLNMANHCRIILEKIIHAEACGESLEGQILVGNVIMNRCKSNQFPDGIYNVVFQPDQFTPIRDGAYSRAVPSDSVKKAVDAVLSGTDNSQGALYFRTIKGAAPDCWHESKLTKLFDLGGHRFYK